MPTGRTTMADRQFTIVEDEKAQDGPTAAQVIAAERAKLAQQQQAAQRALTIGLQAIAQRTVIALANLFTLVTVGSVFWLFYTVHDPNNGQLIALGAYSIFVLLANWIVRRK